MPAYSSSLRLVQPFSGEYPGTWGTQVNNGITALLDTAVAGTANIAVGSTDYTLSVANGTTDEARAAVLNLTAGAGVGARNVICPALSKLYVVYNNTGFTQTIKTAAGSGVAVPQGKTMTVRCDGTNVVEVTTYVQSDNVNFLQSGANATARTTQVKLRDVVSVKDFGAVGDGVANDSTAIQNAVNTLTAGGTLIFPYGTYKINTSILVPYSDITILGNGSTIDGTGLSPNNATRGAIAVFRFVSPNTVYSRTLSATASAGATILTLSSTANAVAGQLIRCYSTEVQYRNSSVTAVYNDQNKIVNVAGSTVKLESPLQYPLTVSPATVTVTYVTPISNIVVDGFTMIGPPVFAGTLANGLGVCGVWANYVDNIVVKNCKFYSFQGIAVGIDGACDVVVSDCYFEGIDPNTVITEGVNSSFYGPYAIRSRRVLFTRCIGQRVRHLYDGAEVYQFVQSDSIANNTHRGAFGSHEEVYDLNIVGNVSYGCNTGVVLRALTANVTGNTITSTESTDVGINTAVMLYTDPGRASYMINSNRITTAVLTVPSIVLSCCSQYVTIADNILSGSYAGIQLAGTDASYENTVITGNTITFDGTASNTTAINVVANTGGSTIGINGVFSGVIISNNTVRNYSVNMISLYGAASVSTPADYIKITDNLGIATTGGGAGNGVILRNGGYYGENIVIRGNTQWNDASEVVGVCPGQTYRIRGYPVVEQNDQTTKTLQGNRAVAYGSSSAPTSLDGATLFSGSVIESVAPVAGGPNYWVVTTAGTNGTIAGVTGDITSGTNTLTLTGNDQTKVYAGAYITVAGAGLVRVRVDSITSNFITATLSANATTTVTGAAVSRANPIISAGANLV